MNCTGSELENVYVLRTPDDGKHITEQANGKHVVIIGTSFIGKALWFNCHTDLTSLSMPYCSKFTPTGALHFPKGS